MSIVLLGLNLEKTRVAKYDTPAKRWQNKSLATDVRQSKATTQRDVPMGQKLDFFPRNSKMADMWLHDNWEGM